MKEKENENDTAIKADRFFVMSEMHDDDGNVSFEDDCVCSKLERCAVRLKERLDDEIQRRIDEDGIDPEDICRPTEEEIYKSLFEDGYLCYVFGEGSSDYRITFHVAKLIHLSKVSAENGGK